MAQIWTVLEVLRWTTTYLQERGVDNPRLDAELLIGAALDKDRVGVYLSFEQPLNGDELAAIRAMVARRAAREPLQYILGACEFFSLPFQVTPAVLIPRPDTEVLVEEALRLLETAAVEQPLVVDVGCGSGAIAVALAVNAPTARLLALDISADALEVARANAAANGVAQRIEFVHGDMSELAALLPCGCQMVVSNPPYIASAEMACLMPEVRDYEPPLALEGGADGLDCYRQLCGNLPNCLAADGVALFEVGASQSSAVAGLLRRAGLEQIFTRCDYAGVERVVGGRLAAEQQGE